MSLIENVQKFYKGNLTLLEGIQEQYEDSLNSRGDEIHLVEDTPISDDLSSSGGEGNFKVLDDVSILKNVMVFAEITRFKRVLLADMEKGERDGTIQVIIDNLDKFDVRPVGYEIKEGSLVIGWYLTSLINTFTFSCQMLSAVDDFWV